MNTTIARSESPARSALRGTAIFACAATLTPVNVWLALSHPGAPESGFLDVAGNLLGLGVLVALLGSMPFYLALKAHCRREADAGAATLVVAGLCGGVLAAGAGVVASAVFICAVIYH